MSVEVVNNFALWQWRFRLLSMKVADNPSIAYGLGPFPVQDASHTRMSIYRFNQYEFLSQQAREAAAERIATAAVRFGLK